MSNFIDGSYGSAQSTELIAKVLAGRCEMRYTRATVGKGRIPDDRTPTTMTESAEYVMDAKISGVSNPVKGECQVTVQIKSDDVQEDFRATNVVLFAEDPDVGEIPYAYLCLENEPEWVGAASSSVGKLITFEIIVFVGGVDNVSVSINSESIATIAEVEKLIKIHNLDVSAHDEKFKKYVAMTTDQELINSLINNTAKAGSLLLFSYIGHKNGNVTGESYNLYTGLNNCNLYSGCVIRVKLPHESGQQEIHPNYFQYPSFYLAKIDESNAKKVTIYPLGGSPVEIIDALTSDDVDKALSAAQGMWLNENKLTNKKRTLTAAELNNPNYPEPYVCSTDKGKEIGLPTSQAYIQYFRNENDDGFGTQIAYKLDRANQEGDNSKLWTMKIRVASALIWGAWENVATSIPKGHYAVTDLNTCQEDGNHYYFTTTTANKPQAQIDGIVSVYAYNAGNNEQQSFAPYIVQVAHSWWQESIFMRSGKNGAFSNWKEVLTSNNAAFSVDDAGLHMKKPLFFTATDGSSHTLQEVFQSASNGKIVLANAITGKGVPTSTTASWQEMARNIGKITGVKTGSIMAKADDNNHTGTIVTLPANMTFAFFYSPNGNRITSVRKINQLYQIASITMEDVIRHRIDSSDCIDVTHYSGTSFKLRPYYYLNGISTTSRMVNWIAIE